MATRTVSVTLVANIGSFVSGMARAGASAAGFGGVAAKVLGPAGVVGGLAAVVSKASAFETAMSGVKAATMDSASALGDLREAALRAGADTQYSATEAAGAIREMAKAGVAAEDIMGGGLSGALSLAAAGQMEVAQAAEIASVAMTQFSLSGEDLPHVADLLAAGAGKAMGEVSDLGAALNQAGLVASAAGLSIEETTGTLSAFASAGLIGSDAGTSLKTMLQRLQNPSEEAAATMGALGVNMYDANGEFIGMEALAGQLKDGMSDMTPAARDAAMAVIFGSDAVRAANVLYKEGATGIADWTAKVNDQGYAAEQAAILNDNLAGDLERLGGAVDTLFIGMGEGSQGPLRALVQGFTDLVGVAGAVFGWVSDLPTPILAIAAAMTAVVLLGGPIAGALAAMGAGMLGLAGRALAATSSMMAFRAAAASTVAFMGGPLGIALIASTVLIAGIASSFQNAEDQADAWADALAKGGAAAASVAAEAQRIRDKQPFDWMADLDEWVGFAPTVDDARRALEQFRSTLDPVAEAQSRVSEWTSTLAYRMDELGSSHEDTRIAQERLAYWTDILAGRQVTLDVATAAASTTSLGAAASMAKFEAETEVAKDTVDAAKQAVDDFKLSLDILTGAHISMMQVEGAFYESLDAAKTALEGTTGAVLDDTGALNQRTDAGRAASAQLVDLVDDANLWIATMINEGATAEEAAKKDADLRQSFWDTAFQMTGSAEAANRLTDEIYGIPEERRTKIEADTQAAMDRIAGVQSSINNLTGRTVEVQVRAAGRFIVNPQGGLQEFADGGWTGPGSKYTPAGIVHADEFVVPKSRVNALGGPARVGSLVGMPGYAAGGPVLPVGYVHDTRSLEATMEQVANAMRTATPKAGVAGSGAVGGAWGSIWQYVKARIPEARQNSTYRAGDPGYHGKGKAIDFGYGSGPGGAGSAGLASINRLLHDGIGSNLAELIYDGIGDDRADLWHGAPHTYNAGTRAEHRNHVHAAVYDQGGLLPHGAAAFNFSGSPERVLSPQQTREFSAGGSGGRGGGVNVPPPIVHVYLDGQEWRGMARVEAEGVFVDGFGVSTSRSKNNRR